MTKAYLGLGSNLGDKAGFIKSAVSRLRETEGISVTKVSSLYRTDPVGKVDQDWFINAVVEIETTVDASSLLRSNLDIEAVLNRERVERWGPRTLDIDILLYGSESIASDELTVPHPRLLERAFALAPLCEIAPQATIGEVSVSDALERVSQDGVERMLLFEESETVAIMGASSKPGRYSLMAQQMLMNHGHSVVPVSLRDKEIDGVQALERIENFEGSIDTVTLYMRPEWLDPLLPGLISKRPKRVIFNPGTESDSIREKLNSEGIETLEACTLVMLQTGQF